MSTAPTLLISLGTSPAIVPEAFLLPDVDFAAVHVLTTAKPDVALVQAFFAQHAPAIPLSITRVADFTDFTSEADHFLFEEVMYRWFIDTRTPPDTRYVCLSGGFKTMSAAMQKAAAVLGAAQVFHVLAENDYKNPDGRPRPPATVDEILETRDRGHIHWIRLGAESGWPQLRHIGPPDYPLQITGTDGLVRHVRAPDHRFREHLQEIVERSHRIAGAWDKLSDLPFADLATWPEPVLTWLNEPVTPYAEADQRWIRDLPKVELHCHLGGFGTHGETLAEIRAAAETPAKLPPLKDCTPPSGWPEPATPIGLEAYMPLGDNNGSALLRDPGCLRRHIELLYQHLCDQNIVYAEIRCSPANYADPSRDRSPWDVLTDIRNTFQRCMEDTVAAGCQSAVASVSASVAAGCQPAETAPNPDSHSEASRAGRLPAPTLRRFIPFRENADYTQTWRDLPHRDQTGATAFVTFRLADSLPKERLAAWFREQQTFIETHPKPWDARTAETYRRRFPERLESWLDEAHGECLLRDPVAADIIEEALRHFDGERYILDTYVIMPNHVHVLVKPLPGHTLRQIIHTWKSYTARRINEALGRTGSVWQEESFDHLVRSAKKLQHFRDYIAQNPGRASLKTGYRIGQGIGLFTESDNPVAAGCQSAEPNVVPGRQPGSQRAGRLPAPTPRCHVNLILIATRRDKGDYRAAIARHLSLAVAAAEHWTDETTCRVVGVDLAGYENVTTRAHYFREEFTAIHRCGLALTVHAGENDDAEGIWRAVFDLNARRLGHALHLIESPELIRSVADRGIAVEMCPYANLQIHGYPVVAAGSLPAATRAGKLPAPTSTYPLLDYLRAGVRVTVNTDNIGISAASLTDNLLLAARLCPRLTRLDILRLQRHAAEAAFTSQTERARLIARLSANIPQP
ncbi:MAG: hypothetical protein D6781_01615 [Verrucomicrobia bacterium]|nr:MAG: hypothetical protein D6781_01615 [Verrucomicrobiota bacterium]